MIVLKWAIPTATPVPNMRVRMVEMGGSEPFIASITKRLLVG